MNKTEEHRQWMTIAITKMSTEIAHIRETQEETKELVFSQNGRVRKLESSVSWLKGIGGTITSVVIAILSWLKLGDFK